MVLFDLVPVSIGATLTVVAFFFVVTAVGIVTIMMLRKTIKMALRMIIVAVILLIAVIGSISLWLFMKPAARPVDRQARPSANSTR